VDAFLENSKESKETLVKNVQLIPFLWVKIRIIVKNVLRAFRVQGNMVIWKFNKDIGLNKIIKLMNFTNLNTAFIILKFVEKITNVSMDIRVFYVRNAIKMKITRNLEILNA
jgi:hypothetical protein